MRRSLVLAATAEASKQVGGPAGPDGDTRRAKLPEVLGALRKTESSVPKIVNRFKNIFWINATTRRTVKEIDEKSLAYGSSFFQSFQEIVMHPHLAPALQ